MCTMIAQKVPASGSGKGAGGWFALDHAYISYDHPVHAQLEHALNIDFVNESMGLGARVAVELTIDAARELAQAITGALAEAEAYEQP